MTNKEAIEWLKEHFNPEFNCCKQDEVINMAISALEKQEGKKPIAVENNIYDTVETHHNCTVQILRNSVTGDVSVGWWKEENDGD